MSTFAVLVIDMFQYDVENQSVIDGFPTLEMATEYARRRTRDSLEEQRGNGQSAKELELAWRTFGEDCLVLGGQYKGSSEIDYFVKHPATAEERDWESL
ncbi:MAG: hypothetical protein ACXV7D_02120, partial [Thermoanaerobaculia bacterium]